jgi:hypothetical protein
LKFTLKVLPSQNGAPENVGGLIVCDCATKIPKKNAAMKRVRDAIDARLTQVDFWFIELVCSFSV